MAAHRRPPVRHQPAAQHCRASASPPHRLRPAGAAANLQIAAIRNQTVEQPSGAHGSEWAVASSGSEQVHCGAACLGPLGSGLEREVGQSCRQNESRARSGAVLVHPE